MRGLRGGWIHWLAIVGVLLAGLGNVRPAAAASGEWQRAPGLVRAAATGGAGGGYGTPIVLYDDTREVQTFVAPPAQGAGLRAQAASITVEYQGFTPEAQAAFQYAVDIWQGLLVAPIPIRIQAVWKPLPQGVLGAAGANAYFVNPTTNVAYPVALAQQLMNRDPNPDKPDIVAQFNSNANWYLGTGKTTAGQSNLASVVLHELGHGLGIADSFAVIDGVGGWGDEGTPLAFDRFVADASNVGLLDTARYPNPSAALAAGLQGGQLFFNGAKVRAANGGNSARLFAPNPFMTGSSVAHLDEETYPAGNPNSLMTPGLARGETVYNPGPIALGILADIGWNVAAAPPPSPPASPSPSPSTSPPPSGGTGRCFPGFTPHCVSGLFLARWDGFGGLAINGYPLTPEMQETLPNEKGVPTVYTVQYFERVRMELHTNAQTGQPVVLLGQFGRAIRPAESPVAALPGAYFDPITGHNVTRAEFAAFYAANGDLAQFGRPIGEERDETLPNAKNVPTSFRVQYFERARFEWHPENTGDQRVQLGQFGRRILEGGGAPSPSPSSSPSPSPDGKVIFRDDFTDPNSGWGTLQDPQGRYSAGYLPGGEYRIALAAANFYAIVANRNIAAQTDVRLESDMKRFGTQQDPLFGFACRVGNIDNYYGGVLDTQGNALVFKFKDGKYVQLAQATNHPAIKRGNETNRVEFDCIGSQLTLIVNGTAVVAASDGDFASGGIGFLAFAFDKGGLDLHLRNFIASRPSSTPAPDPSPSPAPSPSPTVGFQLTATVDDANPTAPTPLTVTATLTNNGRGVAGATLEATWYYRTTTVSCSGGPSGSDGRVSCTRDIAGATSGYTVVIDVVVTYQGQTFTAQTSFTPR